VAENKDAKADKLEGNPPPAAPSTMAAEIKVSRADKKQAQLAADAAVNDVDFSEDVDRGPTTEPRYVQFPSLAGEPDVEVAERTIDYGNPTFGGDPLGTSQHVKDFVTPRRDYENERDAIHVRNINAVRQSMISQGIRPIGDVVFLGETDLPDGISVALRYGVESIPAAVANTYDTQHAVVSQTGPTPTELAEFEAGRAARVVAARDLMRAGTVEAGPVVTESASGR